jgi:hypothetical protein
MKIEHDQAHPGGAAAGKLPAHCGSVDREPYYEKWLDKAILH